MEEEVEAEPVEDIDEDEIESAEDSSEEDAAEEEDHVGNNSNSYGLRPKKSGNIFDSLKVKENDLKGCDSADLDE